MLFRICHKLQEQKIVYEIHGQSLIENLEKNFLKIDWGIIIVRHFYLSFQIQY